MFKCVSYFIKNLFFNLILLQKLNSRSCVLLEERYKYKRIFEISLTQLIKTILKVPNISQTFIENLKKIKFRIPTKHQIINPIYLLNYKFRYKTFLYHEWQHWLPAFQFGFIRDLPCQLSEKLFFKNHFCTPGPPSQGERSRIDLLFHFPRHSFFF